MIDKKIENNKPNNKIADWYFQKVIEYSSIRSIITIMLMIIGLIIFCVVLVVVVYNRRKKNRKPSMFKDFKDVPSVAYNFPIVGHGVSFSKDIMGFIIECKKKYGDVFHVKIFRKNICIVCDKRLVQEFFKKQEHEMSMYENLKTIYFDYAFSDDGSKLNQIIDIMNKTIAVKFDEFLPKIVDEAQSMASALTGQMKLTPVTIGFVSRTSARCFLGFSLTAETSAVLNEFTDLLNVVTTLTYFFPKWIIRQTIGRQLVQKRKAFGKLIQPHIEEYRQNPNKTDSLVIRHCVDRVPQLSDDDICNTIVCLMYVSTENTALGLNATLIDLLKNPKYMERLRAEMFQSTDDKQMIKDQTNLLHSCVLESARMNSHVFAITRNTTKISTLGDYYIGNIDHVALCEPILMTYPEASDTFDKPTEYFPERYQNNPSLRNPTNVFTWGAGPHLCPGKLFAIYEIKTAIMTLLRQYDISANHIPKLDYFSPSAFGDMANMMININKNVTSQNQVRVQTVGSGFLLRNYLSEGEQIKYYNHLVEVSKDSKEHKNIFNEPTKRAFPICIWNNAYTGTSNCNKPQELIDLGNKIISEFPDKIKLTSIDSVYGQLFGADGFMSAHYDQHVDWGISINLGASVLFTFGKDVHNKPIYVVINTGDVFFGDFAKNFHGIECVFPNTPFWFEKEVTNFGRTRCSIQLRNVSNVKADKITDDNFMKLLKSY